MFNDGLVSAYSKKTGKKQRIPKHWIGHPVFGARFELTPSARAAEAEQLDTPSKSWKRDRLDQHAADLGLDTTDLATKDDVLAAIETAVADAEAAVDDPQNADGTPPSDETPATGDTEEE